MAGMSALGDLLGTVLDRGARLIGAPPGASLPDLCAALMSSRGEASGVALAQQILEGYAASDAEARAAFLTHLAEAYDPDPDAVRAAAAAYAAEQSSDAVAALFRVAEPPRQELFRRLNMAPGGTAALVSLRADLLPLMRAEPAYRRIDADFRHLFASWFNRGFLVLRPIDWQTPAAILEKIIAYEAVHEIDSWDELRRRVEPPDRRCFAFFHPSMPDEPLIFVEVALTRETPGSIQALLATDRVPVAPDEATTAVFYSISNCQTGLAGVSFGAFLIKQVARDLAAALPGLGVFVTLSPVPGLVSWLEDAGEGEDAAAGDERALLRVAARYFLEARRPDGQPSDPVARFHLGNGAELEAIHTGADLSPRGLAQSLGVMVNYRYRLDRIEANHEAYANGYEVTASRAVRALL